MFGTGHQGRADLVLAVPRGFGPINLPTTWLATDRRDHLPLLMEARQHHGSCRKIDVVAKHVTTRWYHSLYYGGVQYVTIIYIVVWILEALYVSLGWPKVFLKPIAYTKHTHM